MHKITEDYSKTSYNKAMTFAFYIYFVIYTVFSTFTLAIFPRVHSDEIWLGSLSYEMYKSKSLFTTESFFDLFPRTPHTMKILFHSLQQLPLRLFGLSIFNIRLVSLLFSLLTLIILYKLLIHILNHQLSALLITILTSLSSPFLYASHFARQEIILVFVLIFVYYIYVKDTKYVSIVIPLIIGIAISLHPNAFIIACMIGLILLKDVLTKSKKFSSLVSYISILTLFACTNILVSISQNPNFIQDYLSYGKTLSVNAAPVSRLINFKDFYLKCYNQITGTYYIPPMKLFLIGTVILIFIGVVLILTKNYKTNQKVLHKYISNSLLMIIGFNIGLFIIGRYNTTSIVFMFIPSILLLATVFISLLALFSLKKNTYSIMAISVLILIFTFKSYTEINHAIGSDYSFYEKEIQSVLTDESVVLGNLSSGFVFKDLPFKDIRNLKYLDQESVFDYLTKNSINTVIYYEEYDYIHRNQQWEILYGDDEIYYNELNKILVDYGSVIHEFEDMDYGTRIIRYMGEYPWKVTIYHLDFQK